MRKQAILSELYPKVSDEMDKVGLFKDFGGSEVLDQGMPTHCPLIYGGRKSVDQKSYICTGAYDHEAKEFKLEEALQDYKLYDNEGNVLPATIRNLPRVFSIFINNRQTHELKIDIHKQVHTTPAQITDYTTDEIERNLEEASILMPLISSKRSDDFNDWIKIGWTLYNISENRQGLNLWIDFSKRSIEKTFRILKRIAH